MGRVTIRFECSKCGKVANLTMEAWNLQGEAFEGDLIRIANAVCVCKKSM